MFEGATKSGFAFSIDERVVTDWRLAKAIARSESDDESESIVGFSDLVTVLLGGGQLKKLEKHIAKNNDGYVPLTALYAEVTDILQSVKELKNC